MSLKQFLVWPEVPPQAFTADGTAQGVVSLQSVLGFYQGQNVVISATGLRDKAVRIKRLISLTQMVVGPQDSSDRWSAIDLYTVALGATIYAPEQPTPIDRYSAAPLSLVLEHAPIASLRTILTDPFGQFYSSTNPLPINVPGSIAVTGTVNTNLNGLAAFQTSQYVVGTTAVQLAPVALANRSSMSIKVVLSSGNILYLGNSNAVTTSTGYAMFNGDSIQLDLNPTGSVWAIATAPNQSACTMEIGG